MGFVGFGAISHAVAKILDGFECDISFYDPFIPESQGHYKKTSLEELFATCDVVSLHLPVSDSTRAIVTEKLLRSMKKTALFVNAARSAIVDYDALDKALEDEVFAGAIIDVYDNEPPLEKELKLCNRKNVMATPHTCGSTFEVTDHQAEILNDRIGKWFKKENLEKIVYNKGALA